MVVLGRTTSSLAEPNNNHAQYNNSTTQHSPPPQPHLYVASLISLFLFSFKEIRNFKKCLIMMFRKQGKEVVFLETVIGLAKQHRHCLVECIPLPEEIARQAPLYFKKNFPCFHVELGLEEGFVHVIDDESQFNSIIGLNVIRGMLQLPEEDMHRRVRSESVDRQKVAVATFAQQ
ncbi:hypothetical protein Sjap_021451 [Stephania japonica]|uniref:Cwf19-like C-terminal domain-containing protein n=1 Tax=Stephania japonica TaxID=461633 RepID=A0AAP0HRJ3_9MAGN